MALPPAARVTVWAVALALEIAGTIWAYVSMPGIPAQVSHMDERFGLFTIIVLGESVLAVATGGTHVEGAARWVVVLCGIVLACGIWWLYFASAAEDIIDRALRSSSRHRPTTKRRRAARDSTAVAFDSGAWR